MSCVVAVSDVLGLTLRPSIQRFTLSEDVILVLNLISVMYLSVLLLARIPA